MLAEASVILGRNIATEAEFYQALAVKANHKKLAALERKYFDYHPEENTGLIPQAVDQIRHIESEYLDKDGLGHQLKLTHQRYQSLAEPIATYLLTVPPIVVDIAV